MADTLSVISLVSYLAAAVFAAASVVLWFVFKIPSVIGDLSGRNAKKSVEQMRKANEKSGNKLYGSRAPITPGGKGAKKTGENPGKKAKAGADYETGLLGENKAQPAGTSTTGLLDEENETGPLETGELMGGGQIRRRVDLTLREEIMFVHTDEVLR